MIILTNQKSKTDTRVARIVVTGESDEDYELLEDLLKYLQYREIELNGEGIDADLRISV
jgi:hypothetical protein